MPSSRTRTLLISVLVAGCALVLVRWVAVGFDAGTLTDSAAAPHAGAERDTPVPVVRPAVPTPQALPDGARSDGTLAPNLALTPGARVVERELTPAARDYVLNRLAAHDPSRGRVSKEEWLAAGLPQDHPAFRDVTGDYIPSNVGIAIPVEPPVDTKGGLLLVVFEEYRRELARRGVAEPTDQQVLAYLADQNARVRALNEALWDRRHELQQNGAGAAISPLERELIQRHFLGSELPPEDDSLERMDPEELAELQGSFVAALLDDLAEAEQRESGGTP